MSQNPHWSTPEYTRRHRNRLRCAAGPAVIALAVGAGLSGSGLQAQQRDFSQVEIETIRLEADLFMLVGSGGNIGLSVGNDGAFLIDDQFAPLTEKILAAVEAVSSEPVRWVLNTHWHGDHTGGNENLGEAGAMIVAHENVYRRMNPGGVQGAGGAVAAGATRGASGGHLRRCGLIPLERASHQGDPRRKRAHGWRRDRAFPCRERGSTWATPSSAIGFRSWT